MTSNFSKNNKNININHLEINPLLQQLRDDPIAGNGENYYFSSFDGTKIFYRVWKPISEINRIIIISHGMGGHGEFFVLLADKLYNEGIMVIAPDYRNHGHSGGKKGDLKRFKHILKDLHEFINYIYEQYPNTPIYLVGESMGGAVNINYIAEYPENLTGMILFSPAVKINLPIKRKLMLIVLALPLLILRIFAPSFRVIGAKGREDEGINNPIHQQYDKTDPNHLEKISARYLFQLFKYIRKSVSKASKINIPTVIFQGTSDMEVSLAGVSEFYEKLNSDMKELYLIEGGYHCLFTDPNFRDKWHLLIGWLKKH